MIGDAVVCCCDYLLDVQGGLWIVLVAGLKWNGIIGVGRSRRIMKLRRRRVQRCSPKGGNAVDAAVAASFTLSVVRPYSCGIGGGGFMVIHLPNDPIHGKVSTAINYRETSYVEGDYFGRNSLDSERDGASVAIPGTVAGLLYALDHYGTLDRETVLGPAMEAAIAGFVVDAHYEEMADGTCRESYF